MFKKNFISQCNHFDKAIVIVFCFSVIIIIANNYVFEPMILSSLILNYVFFSDWLLFIYHHIGNYHLDILNSKMFFSTKSTHFPQFYANQSTIKQLKFLYIRGEAEQLNSVSRQKSVWISGPRYYCCHGFSTTDSHCFGKNFIFILLQYENIFLQE